jgi:subtilase family serine protease
VQGSYPRDNTGWSQESALDLDMASAMCPNCRIILVEADSASYSSLAAAVNMAASLGAKVISNSYGGGESGSSGYASAYAHPGVAVTASAGDSGYGASFPATAPGVIAVGGTTLSRASNSRGWTETVWSGTGSGCSSTYAKPAWQTDGLCATRMETDISAVADPATGVAVYGPAGFFGSRSGWLVFGGTSVSAPLIGGIYGALGAAPNAAQKIWQSSAAAFNDVTSGSNGSCSGTYLCTSGVGYDGPTGWGTPSGPGAF